MQIKRAVLALTILTIIYISGLVWLDSGKSFLGQIPLLLDALLFLFAMSFASYFVRYLRWYWLLTRSGNRTPFWYSFIGYLSGFSFTATPGKVGELYRMRFFVRQAVLPWRVLATFVYERACDLIVVLLLASLVIQDSGVFFIALGFVALVLLLLVLATLNTRVLTRIYLALSKAGFGRFSALVKLARKGLNGCACWMNVLDISVSFSLGGIAWLITSLSFILLLHYIGVSVPFYSAISIFPLAMLAGAASMLPGGVGSTEVVLIGLLAIFGVDFELATLAAIGIRLATIWFAIALGIICSVILEIRYASESADSAAIHSVGNVSQYK